MFSVKQEIRKHIRSSFLFTPFDRLKFSDKNGFKKVTLFFNKDYGFGLPIENIFLKNIQIRVLLYFSSQ